MKRGQFELQFNWIFIIMAGAVILAFFFSIVQKQQTISEQRLALTLINQLDSITTGASIAKGAAQQLDLPPTGVAFACSDECTCTFSIGDVTRDYRDKLIFAPKSIKGDNVLFWTLDWTVPYRAANFLFATNEKIKYFLVHDDTPDSLRLLARITALLPPQVQAIPVRIDDLNCGSNTDCVKNENYLQVKFVFLNIDPNFGVLELDESFQDTEVSALHITPDYITFFKKMGKKAQELTPRRSYYAGDSALFAAVFAEDEPMYRCTMQKALNRLSYVTTVLSERMEGFRATPDLQTRCTYNTETINQLQTLADSQSQDITSDLNSLPGLAATLQTENDVLLRQSCPTLY